MGTLQIDILGTSFAVSSTESQEYLDKLLAYYKNLIKQVEEHSLKKDPLQVAIFAGIQICDELYKEKKLRNQITEAVNHNSIDEQADQSIKSLIEKIDRVL